MYKNNLAAKILLAVMAASVVGTSSVYAAESVTNPGYVNKTYEGTNDRTDVLNVSGKKNDDNTAAGIIVGADKGKTLTITNYDQLNIINNDNTDEEYSKHSQVDGLNAIYGGKVDINNINTISIGTDSEALHVNMVAVHAQYGTVTIDNVKDLYINVVADGPSNNKNNNANAIFAQASDKNDGIVSITADNTINIKADGNAVGASAYFDTKKESAVKLNAKKVNIESIDGAAVFSATKNWESGDSGQGYKNANTLVEINGIDSVNLKGKAGGLLVNRRGSDENVNGESRFNIKSNGDITIDGGDKEAVHLGNISDSQAVKTTADITGKNIILKTNNENSNAVLIAGKSDGNTVNSYMNINQIGKDGKVDIQGTVQVGVTLKFSDGEQDSVGGQINLSAEGDTSMSSGVYDVNYGGNVNFNKGEWTVNGWRGDATGNLKVAGDATLNINDNISVDTAILEAGSTVVIDADKVTGTVITVGNAAGSSVDDKANVKVNNINTGTTLKVFGDKDNSEAAKKLNEKAVENMTSNNMMQNFTVDKDGNIKVVVADASKVLKGGVLNNIVTNLTEKNIKNDFFNDLLTSGDAGKAVNAINSAANIGELGGTSHGTYSMSNIMTDAVADHLSLATHGEQDKDVWAHYIHNKENVSGLALGGVDGNYDAQYNGIVVGSDLYKNGKATVGVALSYAEGNIDGSTLAARTSNDAEYYGASVYGRIDNGDSAVLGDISYLHSKNDIEQTNSGKTITAAPKADAFSVGVKAEQVFNAGAAKFVPYAGLRYMHLGVGNYEDSLGMGYNSDEQNLWLLPVGVTYSQDVKAGSWTIRPVVEAGYVWTMGDRDTQQTVSLNGASDGFGFDVADSGSFISRFAVEAEKANVTYGLGYEYQKGDTVKANKWLANVNFSF